MQSFLNVLLTELNSVLWLRHVIFENAEGREFSILVTLKLILCNTSYYILGVRCKVNWSGAKTDRSLGSCISFCFHSKMEDWYRGEKANISSISFSRDLPNPEIEARSPALQTDDLPSEPPGKPILLLYNISFSLYLKTVQEIVQKTKSQRQLAVPLLFSNFELSSFCIFEIIFPHYLHII